MSDRRGGRTGRGDWDAVERISKRKSSHTEHKQTCVSVFSLSGVYFKLTTVQFFGFFLMWPSLSREVFPANDVE